MFKGSITALITPFKNGGVDETAFQRFVEWQIEEGTNGLVPVGTTGESPTLSHEEHKRVVELCVEAADNRVPVIAGSGSNNTEEALELSRHAEAAGADALLVVTPYYNKPTQEGLYRHFRKIAESVDLPMILFQLQPALGGVDYTAEVMERLLSIDSVVAIKEASFDAMKFVRMRSVLDHAPRHVTLLTGNDNFICHSFVLGAEGALIGFGTLAIKEQVAMIEAARRKDWDEAFRISDVVQPLADLIFSQPVPNYRARTKEALRMVGVIENVTMRPPLLAISDEDRQRVRKAMERAGQLQPAAI
jgi:4-hydroxy-tetrahydrodipicolinate synthase